MNGAAGGGILAHRDLGEGALTTQARAAQGRLATSYSLNYGAASSGGGDGSRQPRAGGRRPAEHHGRRTPVSHIQA